MDLHLPLSNFLPTIAKEQDRLGLWTAWQPVVGDWPVASIHIWMGEGKQQGKFVVGGDERHQGTLLAVAPREEMLHTIILLALTGRLCQSCMLQLKQFPNKGGP